MSILLILCILQLEVILMTFFSFKFFQIFFEIISTPDLKQKQYESNFLSLYLLIFIRY
jgi:hypothetical protein